MPTTARPPQIAAEREAPPLSPAKRALFTGLMLAVPVVFFLLLEGGLRLAGYGDAYPLFVLVATKADYVYQNRDVARRYFVNIADVPESQRDYFRAEKAPNALRVFVQGGSTAAGFPYYYGGSFSRMLERRLQRTFPEREVEVVNTAMSAVNSYTLLDLADEIIEQQPDAVLIYAGHNEYYGALGVGSSQKVAAFPWLNRAYLGLMKLRTGQLLRAIVARSAALLSGREKGRAPSGTLMQRMVGEQSIPYGSGAYRLGLRQFESNMDRLLAKYAAHGIPVYIATLAANERDHPPFASGLSGGVDEQAWRRGIQEAERAAAAGRLDEALWGADEVIALDSAASTGYFVKGRILEKAGRVEDARTAYLQAKDRDALRFRAPEAVNAVIRRLAQRHGATLVDAQERLRASSPDGIIGSAVMVEHLHPNVNGYAVLSDAFYEALRDRHAFGDWSGYVTAEEARAGGLMTAVDSLAGTFRVRSLMGSWPFKAPGVVDHTLDTLRSSDPLETIALRLYRNDLSWFEATEELRRLYEQQGRYDLALQAALAEVEEYPFEPLPNLSAGNVLMLMKQYDKALPYFETSNKLKESPPALTMIGSILLSRGDQQGAIPFLERAVEMDPQGRQALYNLAGAYALSGNRTRAREVAERLVQVAPNDEAGRQLLLSLGGR